MTETPWATHPNLIRTEEDFLAGLTPEQLAKRNQTPEELQALLAQADFDQLTEEEKWEWVIENDAGYDNSLWFESNYTAAEAAHYDPEPPHDDCPSCCGTCYTNN